LPAHEARHASGQASKRPAAAVHSSTSPTGAATDFGWVDRRFVRDGHIVDLPHEAVTLYVTVHGLGEFPETTRHGDSLVLYRSAWMTRICA
jgi:hypothetical protein